MSKRMIKEKAIEQIKWYFEEDDGIAAEDVTKEAINMAIEALQQITCKDCRHKYEEGDCTHYYWCRLHDSPVDNDNYCCWAERRE